MNFALNLLLRRTTLLLVLLLLSFMGTSVFQQNKAHAAYDGGRIIDNSLFLDASSMTSSDIQSFLNSKGGQIASRSFMMNCDAAGQQAKQAYLSLGAPCGQDAPASHIIFYASQVYGISPKVVLATLQKEQSLVTAVNPTSRQYSQAMGYACPTSGSCDDSSNFFWQIDNGVWVLRFHYERARKNMNWWYTSTTWTCGTEKNFYKPNLYPGQNVNFYDEDGVMYRTHYIENAATSSMYCYTPHAYNNPQGLYGRSPYGTTGRYYSGSYNFVYFYEIWFGSTKANRPVSNVDWKFENLSGGSNSINPTTDTVGLYSKTVAYNDKLYVFSYNSTKKSLAMSWADSGGWHHEILDGNGTDNGRVLADVGKATAAIVHEGAIHLFYYDTTNHALRHAWFTDSDGWAFETLDGSTSSVSGRSSNVGMSNTAVVHNGSLQLFYYDASEGNLRHAWFNQGAGWKFENLEGDHGSVSGLNSDVGQNPEIIEFGGTMQLFYYDVSRGNLRHAWASSTQPWKFEDIDGEASAVSRTPGNVGQDPTITAHGGSLQLFYYDVSRGNLRHAWASSTQPWKFENLDGDPGSVGTNDNNTGSMSRTISHNNVLYVYYRENSAGLLRYAWADSGGWHFAPLDGSSHSISEIKSNTGFWPSVTTFGGSIQLFYFDNDQRSLRHTFGAPYF